MRIVILCGGSGSRLWPVSRESFPKQFIPIFDGKSLLDLTVERILKLNFKNKPIFICNKIHRFLLKETLKKYSLEADIFLEPIAKNTCAAIYLAAKHCSNIENLLIMPADHLIPDTKAFNDDIISIEKNLSLNHWVTLGIKPTKASESYGYIKVDTNKNGKFSRVINFTEKPTTKKAEKFILDKNYYWNSGIFIANKIMVIKSIKEYAPEIAKYCDKAFSTIEFSHENNEFNFSSELFSKIPSQSIDYAVMENETNINLYPFINKWSDVGSWDAISDIYKDEPNNEKIVQIESYDNFIRSEKRTIATIGVNDLIIIDSDNATLIAKKKYSEKVKLVVSKLIEQNAVEAKEHSYEYRPWGKFEVLLNSETCKVKKIIVSPMKRLSLQYHNFRKEHWLVVEGLANVFLDDVLHILKEGMSIDIPKKARHYIHNDTTDNLIIIETQLGTYFGEDDIIRIDDPYKR